VNTKQDETQPFREFVTTRKPDVDFYRDAESETGIILAVHRRAMSIRQHR